MQVAQVPKKQLEPSAQPVAASCSVPIALWSMHEPKQANWTGFASVPLESFKMIVQAPVRASDHTFYRHRTEMQLSP